KKLALYLVLRAVEALFSLRYGGSSSGYAKAHDNTCGPRPSRRTASASARAIAPSKRYISSSCGSRLIFSARSRIAVIRPYGYAQAFDDSREQPASRPLATHADTA